MKEGEVVQMQHGPPSMLPTFPTRAKDRTTNLPGYLGSKLLSKLSRDSCFTRSRRDGQQEEAEALARM